MLHVLLDPGHADLEAERYSLACSSWTKRDEKEERGRGGTIETKRPSIEKSIQRTQETRDVF
jgi:hypothetical protein